MNTILKTVPNQRIISVVKEIANKDNLYTINNLKALNEAAKRLQSKGGFKLYIYIAKNQNNYKFALSSSDFITWSGVGIRAYNTAFQELVDNGYLVKKDNSNTIYTFYEKSVLEPKNDITIIEYDQNETDKKIQVINTINSELNKEFVF